MIRAIVFDFDGTILDTESAEFTCWQEVYRAHGLTLQLDHWQQGVGTQGGFDPWLALPEMLPAVRSRLAADLEAAVEENVRALDLRPGVRETLQEARAKGYELAMASSSGRAWVEPLLVRHGLLDCFTVVTTRDDVEIVKPDPQLYTLAVQRLDVRPEEALAVEDSLNGATAAAAAGLRVIIVPNQITASQPFPEGWPRLNGFDGGLAALLEAAEP